MYVNSTLCISSNQCNCNSHFGMNTNILRNNNTCKCVQKNSLFIHLIGMMMLCANIWKQHNYYNDNVPKKRRKFQLMFFTFLNFFINYLFQNETSIILLNSLSVLRLGDLLTTSSCEWGVQFENQILNV